MISVSLDSVPSSPYPDILNFRDVGKTINLLLGKRYLKEDVLFRSAHLDDAGPEDRNTVLRKHHIHTIVDLRSPTEHAESAKRLASMTASTSASTQARSTLPSLPPDIRHETISLTGAALERALVWRLSWWNIIKLILLLILGFRLHAIALLGRHVLRPRGLRGLAIDTLTYSHPPLLAVLTLLAHPTSYPSLVHCTQGKDRTGLVILLALLLCRVPLSAIAADYRASERELEQAPDRSLREAELRRLGMGAEFARCDDGFVDAVVAWLDERGGIQVWMESIGGGDVVEGIREALLV